MLFLRVHSKCSPSCYTEKAWCNRNNILTSKTTFSNAYSMYSFANTNVFEWIFIWGLFEIVINSVNLHILLSVWLIPVWQPYVQQMFINNSELPYLHYITHTFQWIVDFPTQAHWKNMLLAKFLQNCCMCTCMFCISFSEISSE